MPSSPSILSGSIGLLGSDAERASNIKNQCDDAIRAQQSDFARGYRAWDIYKAIDGSQYSPEKLKVFKEEDRHPWQFDFTSAKVDTLAGTIVAELPDPDWTPVVGYANTVTEGMKSFYYSDKELFNFPMVLLKTIRDGCVQVGWCEIGESNKYHPTGNISLSAIRHGYLIPDPYWLSDDDRELMIAWKLGWYDAEQMKRIWEKRSDEIDAAVRELKKGRKERPPTDIFEKQRRIEKKIGDQYLVIEEHRCVIENKIRLVGLKSDDDMLSTNMSWIPFPLSNNRAYLEAFAQVNNIDWESVHEVPTEVRTHMVTTVSEIDDRLLLEDGRSSSQPNGLPFLHYSTSRVDGHDKGIAETIGDLQMMFNERMSHVHELVAKASGGAELWNEDLWKTATERQNFAKKANKPGHKEFAPLDDVKNIKQDVGYINVNPAIFQQVSVIYNEMLPLISRVSDAMSSVTNSEDTGVLFERKYQMNRIANILFDKYAKQLVNNLGEAYMYQFQETYGDVEREVTGRNGVPVVLNKRTEAGILNSVIHMPRCKVIVGENIQSSTYQMRQRVQIQDIIKAIPENDYLRQDVALDAYFGSMDMPEVLKAKMDMVSEMAAIRSQMRLVTELSSMEAQKSTNIAMAAQARQLLERLNGAQQAAQPQRPQEVQQAITPPSQEVVEPNMEQQTPAPVEQPAEVAA